MMMEIVHTTHGKTHNLKMKINNARAIARLLGVLYRLKILPLDICDKLVNKLTVSVLKDDLSKRYPKEYLKEDFNDESLKD